MSASRSETLSVLVCAEQAGTLEHINGRLAFSYLDSYRGPDLSVSMLGERLMPRIQALCSTTLLNLDRDGRSLRIDPLIAGTA